MSVSAEAIAGLAPDPASLKNGQKLAAIKNWKSVGRTDTAVWGECQGSALYQVRAELVGFKTKCSCPSRKFPCKHALGLMLLLANTPASVGEAAPPEWVAEWLGKQTEAAEKKAAKVEADAAKPVDEKARAKRIVKRETLVADGLDRLDTWLADVVRGGLGRFEAVAAEQATEMSRRLVDCQAAGLAGTVETLGTIPFTGPTWPGPFLATAGRLRLLTHAYRNQDRLAEDLRADVRQAIGWTVDAAEIDATGEAITDRWAVIGQRLESDDRIETQRSWLVGLTSGRTAMVLQFRPLRGYGGAMGSFAEAILPQTVLSGTLTLYPGRAKLRARITSRDEAVAVLAERVPGHATWSEVLTAWAETLGRWPYLTGLGVVLRDATLIPPSGEERRWFVRDAVGEAIPLLGDDHWVSLALTGGHAADLCCEFEGESAHWLGLAPTGRTP